MDVAHQFEEIDFLFADNRFVSILKKMPMAAMALIVGDGMPSEQAAHVSGKAVRTAAEKDMGVIVEKGPSMDQGLGFDGKLAHPGDETFPVDLIIHDAAFLDPPDNDVMQGTWSIESCLPWHRSSPGKVLGRLAERVTLVNNVPIYAPDAGERLEIKGWFQSDDDQVNI